MTQAGGTGVAYEYIAQLVNKLQVNPWINVPHLATDDYVKSLALFLKEHVDSKLVIHVEYSNECWNTEFACNAYASAQGQAEHLPQPYESHWYSNRVCQIRTIFDSVFTGVDNARLYFVMGTQFVNSWLTQQRLWNNNSQCVHGIAVGAYFGLGKNSTGGTIEPPQILAMSMDALFSALDKGRQDY